MSSMKTLFIIAVLGAVAYGVYVSINKSPESPTTADGSKDWPEAPLVELPSPGAATPQFPSAGSLPEMAPRFPSGGSAAPGVGQLAGDPPVTPSVASPAPPYGSLGPSALPLAAPGDGAASAYPSRRDAGQVGDVVPASTLGGLDASRGIADSRRLGADNAPREGQGAASDPLASRNDGKFSIFMQAIQTKLDEGQLVDAHLALSSLYGSPDLPPEHVQEITGLLDQLAGTIVYSRQHLLEPPYRVRPNETLEQIAATYGVPWQLLARINGIRDPRQLEPGRELKVVRGPFSATIDLDQYELTLMVGGRYAGRFPIGVGRDRSQLEGSYTVRAKVPNPPYTGPDLVYAPDDPNNPLGEFLIDLGNQIGIHGTNDPQRLHQTGGRGSICLSDQDVADVYGILSIGSRVVVRR